MSNAWQIEPPISDPYMKATIKSYGGWTNFMLSYGLKPYEPDDVAESKAIIQGFRDADAREQAHKDSSSSGNQK